MLEALISFSRASPPCMNNSPSERSTIFSRPAQSSIAPLYHSFPACSAISAAFTSAKLLFSPCLPLCPQCISLPSPTTHPQPPPQASTHLPLCKSQLHLSSPLCLQSRLFFKRPSDNTGCDGKVAVIAGRV